MGTSCNVTQVNFLVPGGAGRQGEKGEVADRVRSQPAGYAKLES